MSEIRVAIAGCAGSRGYWFTKQADRHGGYRVAAVIDRLPGAAKAVADGLEPAGTPAFTTVDEALDAVDCDALLVATPDGEHTDAVVAGVAAGCHVFVEKPLAVTLEDCLRIVAADRAAGGRVMVGFNLRFAPVYARMRQLVDAGRLGRILTMQADEFYWGGRTYFRRWNRFRRAGGGLWLTKACHDFDILYWLATALPVRVAASARLTFFTPRADAGERCSECAIESSCLESAGTERRYDDPSLERIAEIRRAAGMYDDLCLFNSEKDTFDRGVANVEFANDAVGVYTVNVVSPFTDRRMRISGTEGTLQGALMDPELHYWKRLGETRNDSPERLPTTDDAVDLGGHGGADTALLDQFAAFIAGQPSCAVRPAEASVAVAMALAATRAADENCTVDLADIDGWSELVDALGEERPS